MFKKYKAFMNNEGKFEQPGARALQDFIRVHDQQLQLDRAAEAVKAAQKRVLEAEEAAREAEARALVEILGDTGSPTDSQSQGSGNSGSSRDSWSVRSRVSGETVTRQRLFAESPRDSQSQRSRDSGSSKDSQSVRSRVGETVTRQRLFAESPRDSQSQRSRDSGSSKDSQSVRSRVSSETVRRQRIFAEKVTPPTKPIPSTPKLGSKKCAICFEHCSVCPNPWQRTRSDLMVSKVVDIDRPKPVPYGITLNPCDHVFCGACLAQTIYHSLNMAFDPSTYGTKLPSYPPDMLGLGRPEFPISCPVCQVKKGAKRREISDATARLVLGESNMDEWNHARFLSTINLLHCPHQGCNLTFDTEDALPSRGFPLNGTRVQCPGCQGSLCRACKSLWHEDLTCLMYQAIPPEDRPADYPRKKNARRHGWAPMLHTEHRVIHGPGDMYSPGSTDSLSPGSPPYSPGSSFYSPGSSPYSPGSSPYSPEASPYTPSPAESPHHRTGAPPWLKHSRSFLAYT